MEAAKSNQTKSERRTKRRKQTKRKKEKPKEDRRRSERFEEAAPAVSAPVESPTQYRSSRHPLIPEVDHNQSLQKFHGGTRQCANDTPLATSGKKTSVTDLPPSTGSLNPSALRQPDQHFGAAFTEQMSQDAAVEQAVTCQFHPTLAGDRQPEPQQAAKLQPAANGEIRSSEHLPRNA